MMTTERCRVEECDNEISDQAYVCPQCGDRLRRLLGLLSSVPNDRVLVLEYPHLPEHERCDDCGADVPGHPVVNVRRTTGLPTMDPGLVDDLVRAMGKVSSRGDGLAYAYRPAEARWTLRDTLTASADGIAHTRGLFRPLNSLQALGGWLTAQVDWLRHQPHGGEVIDELTACIRAGVHAIDNPAKRLLIGVCNATIADERGASVECGAQMYAREHDVEVECTNCGTMHPTRETWDRSIGASEDLLLTRTELVRALSGFGVTVTANQLQGLTRRGRLEAKGMSSSRPARPMYRLGDVRDVLEGGAGSMSA